MNVTECIKRRRSIRKFKPDPIDHSIIDSIISTVSYSPSWKNTQITRYIAIEDPSLLEEIAGNYTPEFNSRIIRQAPVLMALTFIKGLCGYETDGSCSTKKGDRWQMFDVGICAQTFCLAAEEQGLGTVIMGIFDEDEISRLLQLPKDQELAVLIAVGLPDIEPQAPKRKHVEELLQYR